MGLTISAIVARHEHDRVVHSFEKVSANGQSGFHSGYGRIAA